jgi:predicted HTH transcriptional regulator
MSDVIVKEINFKIGDKEISLTPEEAKKLKDVLNSMFEKEVIIQKEYIPVEVPKIQQPWNPYTPNTTPYPYPSSPIIYCLGSGENNLSGSLSDKSVSYNIITQ